MKKFHFFNYNYELTRKFKLSLNDVKQLFNSRLIGGHFESYVFDT